jgi:hypothetical protein
MTTRSTGQGIIEAMARAHGITGLIQHIATGGNYHMGVAADANGFVTFITVRYTWEQQRHTYTVSFAPADEVSMLLSYRKQAIGGLDTEDAT